MQIPPLKNSAVGLAGAIVAAVGLEAFLVPNGLIDGGVVGVSIIAAKIFSVPLGVFLFVLNLPFVYLGYRKLGATFALASFSGIVVLSISTYLLHSNFIATRDPLLAAVFGGAIVGLGVGTVIRNGATLDGAEIIAILADKRTPFTVGEAVMFMNLFIISSAGLIFGWDNAMYSLIAYFVAYKVIDITIEGLDESRSVWIVSSEYKKIGQSINTVLGRKVTYVNAANVSGIASDGIILSVITRIEEQRLKNLVRRHDPKAFMVINHTHEVMGKNYEARQGQNAQETH